MIYFLARSILILMLVISSITGFSQTKQERFASEELRDVLDRQYGVDQRLVSGNFYYGANRGSISGHPYFIDPERKTGSVVIEGVRFDDLELRYDILDNSIVLRFFPMNSAAIEISLKKDNIDNFEMDGLLFVPMPGAKNSNGQWFCQKLVDDEISYLRQKIKWLDLTNGRGGTDFEYNTTERQYLAVDGELYVFRGKRTLYNLFPELKKGLKEYKREKKYVLKKERINNRIDFVNHCNTLLRQSR